MSQKGEEAMDPERSQVMQLEQVIVGKTEVTLNPKHFDFDETTLNRYLQEEAGWFNFYGQRLADLESYLQWHESLHDEAFAERFRDFKEDGGSDKLAEAKAKIDPKVVEAKKKVIATKRAVKKLQLFLKSFDKAHDNAMSFGHMLRREMDKLQPRIYSRDAELEQKVDEIVKAADPLA
jgi:hypothetical protein